MDEWTWWRPDKVLYIYPVDMFIWSSSNPRVIYIFWHRCTVYDTHVYDICHMNSGHLFFQAEYHSRINSFRKHPKHLSSHKLLYSTHFTYPIRLFTIIDTFLHTIFVHARTSPGSEKIPNYAFLARMISLFHLKYKPPPTHTHTHTFLGGPTSLTFNVRMSMSIDKKKKKKKSCLFCCTW